MTEKRSTGLATVFAVAKIGRGVFCVEFYGNGATEA